MVCTVGSPATPNARGFAPTVWSQVDWSKAERRVQHLRVRICQGAQEQRGKQGRNLTKRLLRSDATMVVSVRRIPQSNRGRHTPGMDGDRLTTPDERAQVVDALRQYPPWTAAPVRRVYIPQANGTQRPLGIPTRRDRVLHMVGKNAREPRCEAAFAAQSDGCRPRRGCQEAIEEVSVALNNGAVGPHPSILDADSHGAFDPSSHEFLLPRLGPRPGRERRKQWLQAGYGDRGTRHHTTAGTPQGGVIRPLVAQIALDGLANRLGQGYRVARYADDSLVMAQSLPAIARACRVVTTLLDERGLALHPEKTRLVHRTEGVAFLGFHVQMRGQTLRITPQQQQGQALLQAVRSWLHTHPTVSPEVVLRHLHPLLRGWAMSYRHVGSKQTCQKVDDHLWRALWHWAKRRPPKQPKRWLSRRYCEIGQYGATCYAESQARRGQALRRRLERMPAIPIVRHVQGKGSASPDDPPLQA